MQSILLDPHHQPSGSGFGGRSINRTSRSRYQARQNIIEEPIEDEDEPESSGAAVSNGASRDPYESVVGGLDESKWETSGARNTAKDTEDDDGEGVTGGGGVLGLLYQFQKAQSDGRGVNI
jgi:autophagy-related protein 9